MSQKGNGTKHAVTLRSQRIEHVLDSEITFTSCDRSKSITVRGIWDTGASCTVITNRVVVALGLVPASVKMMNTASQRNVPTPMYLVDIDFHGISLPSIEVAQGTVDEGIIDALIGMDVITKGDFTITNFNGKTTFTFRVPSLHEVDYIQMAQADMMRPKDDKLMQSLQAKPKIAQNDPCHCGSGKLYKRCHGAK